MKVAIVGGGIGGMSLALSLHAAGITDVDVYESAAGIRELGVGINVLPHGVRELTELGLADELAAVGIPTAELVLYTNRGQRIWSEPLGMAAGYRWPQVSIHRGQLLGVLHRAAVARLGSHRIHPGHHLVGFGHADRGGVWGEYVNETRDASLGRIEADVLVGCDGIHSKVRRTLYPEEGPSQWSGVIMWRGVTVGSIRQRVLVYPVSKPYEDEGRALINWVAMRRIADAGPTPTQDWTSLARREEALEAFASFDFEFLDFPALIRGAEEVYQYPRVDRDPLPSWDFGRATLLGDAAHPMHPVGGNGASQAIIDSRVLARELAVQPSIEAAIAAYDARRRPETAAVVQANRQAGLSRLIELVEDRAPTGFTSLNDVVSQQELDEVAGNYKRVAGFEVETLNHRSSLSVH